MQNVRSLQNKMNEVEAIPKVENFPDIILTTETWLNPHTEHLYNINGYNAIYNSRDTRG